MFDTIVVGTDGSEGAAMAVAAAAELAALSGGTLHIVCVGRPAAAGLLAGDPLSGALALQVPDEDARAELQVVLDRAAAPARERGVRVHTHAFVGSPAEMLCEAATKVRADVLVVGSGGMHRMRRFLGSVTNTVAHHAPCSVLIVETEPKKD